jgi:hypothetical protein
MKEPSQNPKVATMPTCLPPYVNASGIIVSAGRLESAPPANDRTSTQNRYRYGSRGRCCVSSTPRSRTFDANYLIVAPIDSIAVRKLHLCGVLEVCAIVGVAQNAS